MISKRKANEYYNALIDKNTEYDGVFFAGIKTTGVFCRPSCPARKPKFENCEFFSTAEEALLASFRPCKRCKPLSHPNSTTELIQLLVNEVENDPTKRWKEGDLRKMGLDSSTVRRQFKRRFGMTFIEYARARRLGMAMKMIRSGKKVIDAQISTGYESSSGFKDAFSNILGSLPSKFDKNKVLMASWIDTKLGAMLAIADNSSLILLEFVDRRGLEQEVKVLRQKQKYVIIPGSNSVIKQLEKELEQYFNGNLKKFKTPIKMHGTPFQMLIWDQLSKIPYGEVVSYSKLSKALNKPKSYRAAAQANGANQLAIIIPCHRVINEDGKLGGYGGGLTRKEWLINHEKENI